MYAINLDVDCGRVKPINLSVEEYILGRREIVETEFLPMLAEL
jgi:hypothetical protein